MRLSINDTYTLPRRYKMFLWIVCGLGLLLFVSGLFFAPERIWPNFLIAEFYILSLGIGAGFFIASLYLSNAGWAVSFRRVPEAVMTVLFPAAVGGLILLFGIHILYEWSHPSAVAHDPILKEKQAWLNSGFFAARLLLYFLFWIFLSRKLLKHSLQQDDDRHIGHTRKNIRYSALYFVITSVTYCLASFDLMMSLQPHWYSTIFGLLMITGMLCSTFAVIVVFMVVLRRAGFDHLITTRHLHIMGNLLLSFSVFWVYMWVSQHMLIWYSNIPEETSFYIFRHFGGWGSLSFLNVLLNWLVPFLALLPAASKRSDKVMLQVAVVMLIGHWLDLYIIAMPATFGQEPAFGVWELGILLAAFAFVLLYVLQWLEKHHLLPAGDPYLIESLSGEGLNEMH